MDEARQLADSIRAGFIDEHFRGSRSHRNDHLNIEGYLDIIGARAAIESVQQHILQRHIRQAGLAFVSADVARVVPVKLQQADLLPRAVERDSRGIGTPKIISQVGAARP